MAPTHKAEKKPTNRGAYLHFAKNDRLVKRITDALDAAQEDLAKLSGDVGSGVTDLRRDLSKLLRDARRHAGKLGTTTRKDLERLQKGLAGTAKSKPAKAAKASKPAKASRATKAGKTSKAAKPSKAKPSGAAKTSKPRRVARPRSAPR